MSERRLIFLAENSKSQCSKRGGKGMFKAFCKTSLFSCLKLHSLKPLLGLYSEDWRQTVGFSAVPLIAKQKTLYWENMYFCKQVTQQSPLSYSSAVLQCGNGIILQNFWCLIRDSCMKDPFPQEENQLSLFSLPDSLPVNSANFCPTQILLRLARMFKCYWEGVRDAARTCKHIK